jgi:hypothetical protein
MGYYSLRSKGLSLTPPATFTETTPTVNHCSQKFNWNLFVFMSGIVTRLQAGRPRNWRTIPGSGKSKVKPFSQPGYLVGS